MTSSLKSQGPSPLAIDLAISRVALAALKAKSGQPIEPEDRSAAAELRDYLRENLDVIRASHIALADLVPEQGMREGLERALSELSRTAATLPAIDPVALERLVRLLDGLAGQGHLDAGMASELFTGVQQFERGRGAKQYSPEFLASGVGYPRHAD